MSVLVGKARRFSTKAAGGPSQARAALGPASTIDAANQPPPVAYRGLNPGPELTVEYEPNQAVPVDGSNRLLRTLSPFVMRVEPPLIYGSDPAALQENAKSLALGLYNAAGSSVQGFTAARASLRTQRFAQHNYRGQGVEEVISKADPQPGLSRVKVEKPTSLGKPAIADLKVAVDIAVQLGAAMNAPPLVLLINPHTMSMAYSRIHQFQDRSRYGYIYQAWGEEQPRLTISAKCGAFYSGGRGVQWASKRDSAAWQNLMNAFTFYRNNGYIQDMVGKSNAHHMVGALSIHYDGWIYYGNMQAFSYAYDDSSTMHGGVEFQMEFVVSTMVDTSKAVQVVTPMRSPIPSLSDPRYMGAGNRALNQQGVVNFVIGDGSRPTGVGGFFGSESEPPLVWQPTEPTVGDPDFISTPRANGPSVATASARRSNKGLRPVPTASLPVVGLTDRPAAFGVS